MTALMIIIGVVLLLPGACSLFFMAMGVNSGVAALGLLISAGGVALIIAGAGRTGRRRPPQDEPPTPPGTQ
jgi:hypothetical protein